MMAPGLEEEEEEEEEGKEEEEEREEEGQGQLTGNAWRQKLQTVTEYLWDPEKRMSLARTGQSRSKSNSSQCPSLVSLAFDVVSRAPRLSNQRVCYRLLLTFHRKTSDILELRTDQLHQKSH